MPKKASPVALPIILIWLFCFIMVKLGMPKELYLFPSLATLVLVVNEFKNG